MLSSILSLKKISCWFLFFLFFYFFFIFFFQCFTKPPAWESEEMQKLFNLSHQRYYIAQSEAVSVSSINNPFSSKRNIFSTNDQIFASNQEKEAYEAGIAHDLFVTDRWSYLGKVLQCTDCTDFGLGKTITITCYCYH